MVSTNHPTIGMDTPTWRGAYDRFLILPQGRINMVTLPPFAALAEQGIPERELWRFTWGLREEFDPVWDMVLEHSTGFSGTFARQVTLNRQSLKDDLTPDLVAALEQSAREEAIILAGHGVFLATDQPQSVTLHYDGTGYSSATGRHSREDLFAMAKAGEFIGTLTAYHGINTDADYPQPAIWTLGPILAQSGPQQFPKLHAKNLAMDISGRYIDNSAHIIIDGRRVAGQVTVRKDEALTVTLAELPPEGMRLLQLQTPGGLISNDFIFHVTAEVEPPPKPSLGDLIHASGWESLLGDWVDLGTRGEFRLSLNWKIKNQLLELTTIDQNGPSVAFIRIDQESGAILHSGTNFVGASISGHWDFAVAEGPKMTGGFLSSEGTQGKFSMQLVPQSNDTMALRVGSEQLATVPMMRKAATY
jgi:hypothetical protein